MVARTAIPRPVPGVGTELDHSKWRGSSGIGVTMETGADEWIRFREGINGTITGNCRNNNRDHPKQMITVVQICSVINP